MLAVIFSLSFHECAHAFWAYKLGDDTAYRQGRITLNPISHLEPIGFLMMLFAPIGWAKPVPVNPANFRRNKNSRTGFMEVALAGPLSNVILAMISYFIYSLAIIFVLQSSRVGTVGVGRLMALLLEFLNVMIIVNLNLAVFNLLPFPPLDGFNIYGRLLPRNIYEFIYAKSNLCMIIMFMLVAFLPGVFSRIMHVIRLPIFYLITKPIDLIFSLF